MISQHSVSFLTLAVSALLAVQTFAKNGTCFFRSGAVADPNFWESCNPNSDGEAHCCYKNNHICLSNKLCYDNLYNHVKEGEYPDTILKSATNLSLTGACTDSSWSDSACPQYCKNNPDGFVGDIRQCPGSNSNWVCGQNSTACKNPFTVPQGFVDDRRLDTQSVYVNLPAVYTSARAVGTTGVASGAVTTVTVTATGASDAGSDSNTAKGNDYNATKIGIAAGLGVPLGISLIALATCVVMLLRANKRVRDLQTQERYSNYSATNPMSPMSQVQHQQVVHESPAQQADPRKLPAYQPYVVPQEMDSTVR